MTSLGTQNPRSVCQNAMNPQSQSNEQWSGPAAEGVANNIYIYMCVCVFFLIYIYMCTCVRRLYFSLLFRCLAHLGQVHIAQLVPQMQFSFMKLRPWTLFVIGFCSKGWFNLRGCRSFELSDCRRLTFRGVAFLGSCSFHIHFWRNAKSETV